MKEVFLKFVLFTTLEQQVRQDNSNFNKCNKISVLYTYILYIISIQHSLNMSLHEIITITNTND